MWRQPQHAQLQNLDICFLKKNVFRLREIVQTASFLHKCLTRCNLSVPQAHMALNDIDAAVVSFKKASDLEPNDGKNNLFLIRLEGLLNKLAMLFCVHC